MKPHRGSKGRRQSVSGKTSLRQTQSQQWPQPRSRSMQVLSNALSTIVVAVVGVSLGLLLMAAVYALLIVAFTSPSRSSAAQPIPAVAAYR